MKNGRQGFTLIEILLAFLLFVVVLSSVLQGKGGSEQMVRQNMKRDAAIRLLQSKMTELEMKMQAMVDKNGIESSESEENGSFDAPYDTYSWKMSFKKFGLELGPSALEKFLIDLGMEKDEAIAQIEAQKLLITNLNKNILENLGELYLEVNWDYLGPQRLYLLTHIMPKKPKVTLTTTAESD